MQAGKLPQRSSNDFAITGPGLADCWRLATSGAHDVRSETFAPFGPVLEEEFAVEASTNLGSREFTL